MIDPERIQRLAAKLGNRNDALEFVRQMRCGGKKYDGGGKYFRTNLQDESPLMYQPMMPVYPEVAVPERYYPEPNLGDYEYPENTGMIQAMPIRREMSVSVPPTGVLADEATVPVSDLFSEDAVARRALKQRYAESGFNDKAVSKAGAQGAWQIMPITLKDYLGRGRGKAGDLNDPEYNRKVRDWVMGIIPRDLQEFWSENDSDRAKLAKLYAAYNWGAGNLRGFLRKKQKAGVDISNPDNWVDDLNPETRRYVKYLAFDEDIPDSTAYTNSAFEKAAMERGYLKRGGKMYAMGGPGKVIGLSPVNNLVASADKAIEKITSGDTAAKVAQWYHDHANKMPSWLHRSIYNTIKESAFGDDALSELKYNFFPNLVDDMKYGEYGGMGSGDNVFLMSPEQQKRQLESLGWKQVDTSGGYGLVNAAVQRYKDATGRDVPMYQVGEDEISREELIPVGDFTYHPILNYTWVVDEQDPETGYIHSQHTQDKLMSRGDTAATPSRYYRDKDGNLYYKEWDFFDHGDYSRSAYDDENRGGYVTKSLTDMSQQYGNILDIAGNPFVKTTGYTSLADDPLVIKSALSTIVGYDKFYDEYKEDAEAALRDIKSGLYDVKANGGPIRIKPENRGKFTALKKRTGHSASWFKAHGTPAQKKMAVFELNSRHWRHDNGGFLHTYNEGYQLGQVYDLSEEQVNELIRQGYEVERV